MTLNASLDAALQGSAPLVCLLVEITLPEHTIRVLDGAAQVIHDGNVYSGEDSIYGTLDAIEAMSEQVGTEAPTVRFSFLPESLAAMADITQPGNQGSPVKIWLGVVDPVSGQLVGVPELLFLGELDTALVDASESSTVITFDVASAWDRLFENQEGHRLNNSFWQSIYPGELGFSYVTDIQRDLPWGYDAPRPKVVSDVSGGSGGGGGGGGGVPPIGGPIGGPGGGRSGFDDFLI
jgi:hypothetical protein